MSNSIKNILVSGGAGFIGSRLSLRLIDKGYSVTVLDNLSSQIHGDNVEGSYLFGSIKGKVNFIGGDVRIGADWERALAGQDAIVHLAAETGTGQSMYQIYKYADVNIGGTALLLDLLANRYHNTKKLIVASSRAVYGEGRYICGSHGEVYPSCRSEEDLIRGSFECKCPFCGETVEPVPTHEDSKVGPQSVYGITKYGQEQMVLVACKSLNIPAVVFRYQNVYGPGQSLSNPYTGILSVFSTQIKHNNAISVFEDGKESRDFVYIDDVVEATILGLENDCANYKAYNVGTGVAVSVFEIAKKLVNLYDSDVHVNVSGNFRIGDIRHNFADLDRIRKDLQFSPRYSFEEGVKNFVQWVNSQEIREDNFIKSIGELKQRRLFQGEV